VTVKEAYGALGLDPSSTTPDEVRLRFRELIRLNHPDAKPPHEQQRANETTRRLVEACALLRVQGFPRVLGRADTGGLRYEPQAVAEPGADPLTWLDDAMRESVQSYLAGVASIAFGIRLAFGMMTMGWQIMRYDLKKFN